MADCPDCEAGVPVCPGHDLLPLAWSTPIVLIETELVSAVRRLTARQVQRIRNGIHPLTLERLHPAATPDLCAPDAPRGQPFTCGSCRFREVIGYHRSSFPKCVRELYDPARDASAQVLDDLRLVSHGAATDVRAWWPACPAYEPGDRGLSADASRSLAVSDG